MPLATRGSDRGKAAPNVASCPWENSTVTSAACGFRKDFSHVEKTFVQLSSFKCRGTKNEMKTHNQTFVLLILHFFFLN